MGGQVGTGGAAVVLVAEDNDSLRAMFSTALFKAGFQVREAADGRAALQAVEQEPVALVVLDIQLPQVDGLEVLAELRRRGDMPVIMVTGRGEEVDRVVGLELGADDYMVKPVFPRELVARVRAVLRRAPADAAGDEPLAFDGLRIDAAAREVFAAGRLLALRPREYDLLHFLASHPRRTFSRAQLLERVWGSSAEFQDPSTVTEHMGRLRRKLADAGGAADRLVTVRGAGYRFDP